MADIVFGKALRNGLARQIAVRTHDHDDAEDWLRTANLKLVCHQTQTPIDDATASRVCTATYAYAGNQQQFSKNVAVIQLLEASARLQGEIVGRRCT
ncbi:MAG: hypothetical protein V4559_07990 [Pseudomonadota bacterium]